MVALLDSIEGSADASVSDAWRAATCGARWRLDARVCASRPAALASLRR
ncbi:MAG: hypothetical protein JNJ42_14640 [Burkholderiaceae bacterium]|nr:hypothetical protein [Burkholderiaceae bacterium]